MNDFGLHKTEDFLADKSFVSWVLEDKENAWWQTWLQQNPHQQAMVNEARAILLSLKVKERTMGAEEMEQQIQMILRKTQAQPSKGILTSLLRWKYAAILIGLIAIGTTVYFTTLRSPASGKESLANSDFPQKTKDIVEVANPGNKAKAVTLEDGSIVRLSPQSVLHYSKQMTLLANRDVYLSGEAFFEVAKYPDKPFRVFTQELVTKVLGTSFTVKAYKKDSQISIVVRTGKVSVYDKNNVDNHKEINHRNLTGVVLTPNQELRYIRDQQTFQKTLVDRPLLINPSEIKNNFQYDDVPVAEVVGELKKAFGINILYDKEAIQNCRITADLSDESIYKKLELICKAMDAKFEVIDGQITIEARACE